MDQITSWCDPAPGYPGGLDPGWTIQLRQKYDVD